MKRTIFSAMVLLLGAVAGCGGGNTTGGGNNPCATVTCSTDQICDGLTGTCKAASVCATVTCSGGTICDGTPGSATVGQCVTPTCGATQCTNGQVCSTTSASCVNPGLPALGVQIDRMGRPAVNTALTNPYDLLPAANPEPNDITKSRYNADAGPAAAWATNWTPYIRANIAILDGLDAGTCGNQFAFNQPAGTAYGTLASILTADALQVDTSKTTCSQYLAVEAGVANNCGGRTLSYDVIDTTYSVLAIGMLTGVSDNIAEVTKPTAAFPYFQPPI